MEQNQNQPPLSLTEDMTSQITGMLMSVDDADYELAIDVIKNCKNEPTTQKTIDKVFNNLLTNNDVFKPAQLPSEFWVIKVNGQIIKPSNSSNGMFKSKKGAQLAISRQLNNFISTWVNGYDYTFSTRPNVQEIKFRKNRKTKFALTNLSPTVLNNRYKHPKRKGNGYCLDPQEAVKEFFYTNNNVEFIKINI